MVNAGPGRQATKYNGSDDSLQALIKLFIVWKLILLACACISPGPGYDTSTQILFDQHGPSSDSRATRAIERLVLRLTRWDGIYFSSLATRGHVNEQEWAFSWALARVTSIVTRGV